MPNAAKSILYEMWQDGTHEQLLPEQPATKAVAVAVATTVSGLRYANMELQPKKQPIWNARNRTRIKRDTGATGATGADDGRETQSPQSTSQITVLVARRGRLRRCRQLGFDFDVGFRVQSSPSSSCPCDGKQYRQRSKSNPIFSARCFASSIEASSPSVYTNRSHFNA